MIDILRAVYPSAEQFDIVIEGARNPRNSWHKKDSKLVFDEGIMDEAFILGDNDYELCRKLCSKTSEHSKFLRMLPVIVTMNAPLYFWKEFDTYKVGTTANSCSTMHTVCNKPFELSDFSCEKLNNESINILKPIIRKLNALRNEYVRVADVQRKKDVWWQIIQLLPSSYNQKRTISLNYAVLENIYTQRQGHKLDEWITFCKWIKQVPLFAELFPQIKD